MRFNSHIAQFTHLKCTIQWCLVYSQGWAPITTNIWNVHTGHRPCVWLLSPCRCSGPILPAVREARLRFFSGLHNLPLPVSPPKLFSQSSFLRALQGHYFLAVFENSLPPPSWRVEPGLQNFPACLSPTPPSLPNPYHSFHFSMCTRQRK